MTTIILRAEHAQPNDRGDSFSVIYHLTDKPAPFPKREVEVRTTAEAVAALEAYKAEVTATGTPAAVCMRVKDGQRSPNGFKAATSGHRFYHPVNV